MPPTMLVSEMMPRHCCIVPENREEKTTEGGLDVAGQGNFITPFVASLTDLGIRVSLFVDPNLRQIEAAKRAGAPVVEIHTGAYHEACASTTNSRIKHELDLIRKAAAFAHSLGLEVHAGHGLTFHNVQPVAAIPELAELNIGHFLIGEAVFMSLAESVKEMKKLMADARMGGLY